MSPFGSKSVTLSMLIDRLTSRCRSTQVKLYTGLIASIDLWPQEMFTFSEMLALVQSESSFSAFVCHRRPAGLQATSDLVWRPSPDAISRYTQSSCGHWEPPSPLPSAPGELCLPTSRLQLSHRHPRMRSRQRIINFSHRSPRTIWCFSFFDTIFCNFFLVLPWWSNDLELENFVENLLHLAIDQDLVCPNTARRELWPRKWFLLGRNPWR